ncbi:MAG: DUF2243 domain-containing protein [Sphaerobacteraceae bacterium]|nr:MAG: DUF2243 domain-containing protein [Sphaerobacteraceae bacterium]
MRYLELGRFSANQRRTIWTGFILGVGLMGAVDSIIFHQLLQWHHFYYDTTQFWRIFSDGLLQGFTAGMLFFGAMRLWFDRHRISRLFSGSVLWAGLLLGAGAFQLFDGIINHKVLRLHQVREGVENNLPYDIAWNGFALLLLLIGVIVLRGAVPEEHSADTAHVDQNSGT